jgi:hypothetical protein
LKNIVLSVSKGDGGLIRISPIVKSREVVFIKSCTVESRLPVAGLRNRPRALKINGLGGTRESAA